MSVVEYKRTDVRAGKWNRELGERILLDCPPRGRGLIEITAVHLVRGERHEHIAAVQWRNPETGEANSSTRQQIVDWLRSDPKHHAWVVNRQRGVAVLVVNSPPPYLRSQSDGVWTDDLLALRRY